MIANNSRNNDWFTEQFVWKEEKTFGLKFESPGHFSVPFIMNRLEGSCVFYYLNFMWNLPSLNFSRVGAGRRNVYTGQAKALINVQGNMCNTSYCVHSYSMWYLAHDPSAKHNDLYHTDEQPLTPCLRIYALCYSRICGWNVTLVRI